MRFRVVNKDVLYKGLLFYIWYTQIHTDLMRARRNSNTYLRGKKVVSWLIIKNLHPCFSMPTLKTATKIHQFQLEYLCLSGSAKSCYGTHRNFKTTRVRTRKKYLHLPIYLNPTCCLENLWLSSTLARKKVHFFFLSPSSEEQTAAVVSFVYMETREADVWSNFYKGWSLSGHAHFHPTSLFIGQQQLRGRQGRFPEVARGERWFMAATPSWTSFPPLWCNIDPTTDSISALFPVLLIYKSNFCCLSTL